MEESRKNILSNTERLKWACRRGMLELDVLLNNFLAEAYPQLGPADQALFVDLLAASDPELFAWLLGQEVPNDAGFLKITEMIRQHAKSRF